jgi:predicted acyl esterase
MQDHLHMGNYHMMIRSEVLRGRYRNSFEKPEPFEPGRVTNVDFTLQDVFHTFKKSHKIQVQVQSTWFPLIDQNPQTFVVNIFEAEADDLKPQTHRVYHGPSESSTLEVRVLWGSESRLRLWSRGSTRSVVSILQVAQDFSNDFGFGKITRGIPPK